MPRKLKSQDGNPYEVIRCMWEGAYVSNFVRLFQKKFGFTFLTTQDIEDALVEEKSIALADIIARLLRYVTGNVNILIANFDSFLRNLLINEKADVPHFLDNGTVWPDLTPEEKLTTLKWLIDHVYQEKEEDIADFLDENYCADDLRGICAGQDAFNNVYWYLDDLRLYREFSHKKQSRKDWECVCLTLSDWHSFIKQYRKTSNLQERELYTYLNCELFPIVEIQLLKEKNHIDREEVQSVIKREREDLYVMLEKKTLLDCNSVIIPSDLNSTDPLCLEKQNGDIESLTFSSARENELPDFLQNSAECEKSSTMSQCEDHLNLDESICSIRSDLDDYTMDIKSTSESNMCAISHLRSCTTKCDDNDIVISSSADSVVPGKVTNTNTSPSVNTTLTTSTSFPDGNLEVSLQQPLSDIPSDSSSVTSNKENAPPSSANISNDIPPMSAISNMLGSTSVPATTVSVQPLPSNMVNKTSFQMETQYMQQQSQIFVFSTALANKAADSYLSGHFPSLIAYHCAQPGTKSFLEKYPLKVQQFNRQNPAAWLNTLAQMKQTGRQMKPHVNQFSSPHTVNNRCPGPSAGTTVNSCSGFCNMHSSAVCSTQRGPPPWSSNCGGSNMVPIGNDMCSQQWMSHQFPLGASSSMGHRFPFSQGVKVPDENLTPQQRQHREEQLAMIRKMQQMLFPEQQQHMEAEQSGIPQHSVSSRFGANEMCSHPGMEPCFNSHQPCMGDPDQPPPLCDVFPGNSMMGPGFSLQEFPPNSVSAQMEWQKLQHQFYEERRKKQVGPNVPVSHSSPDSEITQDSSQSLQSLQNQPQTVSQPSTPQQNINNSGVGLSPSTRIQGPPPPYHQANRRAVPSSHPASPNTSSLSLPSPHVTSGLPSPADASRQFPIPTPPGARLSHPSPSPTTPVGSNSLHTTPLNSPKPATNGSQSNSGTLIRTPTTPSSAALTPTSTPSSSCVTLSNSAPNTPTSLGNSNCKQAHSCNSDIQVSGSTNTNPDFASSCSMPTTNNMQGKIFCQNLQPYSQLASKQDTCGINPKEPSLMPVPSPQQIQYLNAFDGQELTIQKQPNTSIRDLDIMSPASIPPSIVMSTGSHSQYKSPEATSFPNTPGSCPSVLENSQDSLSGRYPLTATMNIDSNIQRFTGFDSGPGHMGPHGQTNEVTLPRLSGASNLDMIRMPGPGAINPNSLIESSGRYPGLQNQMFGAVSSNISRFPMSTSDPMQRFCGPSLHVGGNMDVMHSHFMRSSPHMTCIDNIPHNLQLSSMPSDPVPHMQSQSFPSPVQTITSNSSPCLGNNFMAERSQSHLQNLQKMTPPFESVPGSKISSDGIQPIEQCSNSSLNGSNMSISSYDGSNSLTSTSQVGPSQRLSHFDPIASMAAMSDSTVSLPTVAGNSQLTQNMITSNMSMTNLHMTGNAAGINQTNISFHGSIPPMQSTSACSMPNPRPPFSMQNQMPQNVECSLQANTYANATMPVSQMNLQNTIKPVTYNNCSQDLNLNSHPMYAGCPADGANTISCSVTTNDPIMHTSVTSRPNSNLSVPGARHGTPNFPGQLNIQRSSLPNAGSPTVMPRGPPHNSSNIHVKAGAPNTIQYLPARQQNPTSGPIRGSTIEFLQRFAAPLTNLDNKVPTHNLQYFPNSGGSHPPGIHSGMNINSGTATVTPSMMNGPRPVNMMMGPMLRGTGPKVSHPGNQLFSVGASLPNTDSLMFSRPPCPSNSLIPMHAMGGGQSIAMFNNKQIPLPMGGMAPDATQPLPPSMGQSFNYKQSPFYGPTTADPNYAVQFHNFQQQLYATNTRGSQINSQNNITGQRFFGAK